ncbi:MAG: hypothetical protein AAGB93_07050 [Planctomycetota bacterium]
MTSYEPLRRSWSAAELLDGVGPHDVRVTLDEARPHAERLWTDLAAEYDGRLLQAEVLGRGTEYTPAFHAFLRAWAEDEEHHARGLLRLCSLVLREPEGVLLERLGERRADFTGMGRWLDDEFALTVLLAYDEAMSTHGYGEDIPFYASLGPPPFERLLRELKNDEAVHYRNAVELLVAEHAHRADEVAQVLDEVVAYDAAQGEYRATFLLDHASDQFSRDDMERVGRSVRGAIDRRMRRASRGATSALTSPGP